MEPTRGRKYGREEVSPERSRVVWREKSPRYYQNRKVAVVYYLCRNRQLEHPHFMEVSLTSPQGLFLRDVIERLNALRGRGMASLYSWSSKRSYKNGFVWHDLCEDDLIIPTNGNEYVLKGSELFDEPNSDRFSPIVSMSLRNLKQLPAPPVGMSLDDSSSSSSLNGKETKNSQEDEHSPPACQTGSAVVSPDSRAEKGSSWNGSLSLTEYKVDKNDGSADASTQTEENVSRGKTRETCTRGVCTEDGSTEHDQNEVHPKRPSRANENPEVCSDAVSPPPASSSTSSSGGKTETLESLIKADATKFRIYEAEHIPMPANSRVKATNMLLQLISCGSISVKDHSFGLIPAYHPRFSNSRLSSPWLSTSVLGDLDCLSENPRMVGLRLEEKAYFSGSLIETNYLSEDRDGLSSLKRSSSYNADRSSEQLCAVEEKEPNPSSGRSKCMPLSIKASLAKQPRSEPIRSPLSDKPRTSSDRFDGSRTLIINSSSNSSSKRITEPSPVNKISKKVDSFREDEQACFGSSGYNPIQGNLMTV
ncbi:hypothetical protein MLD38_008279 [Melastoma candidum]|uniref:Uncharacterized protein n=1 Tax=Melastoma candidum TaxID=119954 RepID=A0ACB9RTZ8_9MYRT|nr:hypothetical protein MLD38_008279 [Melastoma candidum]